MAICWGQFAYSCVLFLAQLFSWIFPSPWRWKCLLLSRLTCFPNLHEAKNTSRRVQSPCSWRFLAVATFWGRLEVEAMGFCSPKIWSWHIFGNGIPLPRCLRRDVLNLSVGVVWLSGLGVEYWVSCFQVHWFKSLAWKWSETYQLKPVHCCLWHESTVSACFLTDGVCILKAAITTIQGRTE